NQLTLLAWQWHDYIEGIGGSGHGQSSRWLRLRLFCAEHLIYCHEVKPHRVRKLPKSPMLQAPASQRWRKPDHLHGETIHRPLQDNPPTSTHEAQPIATSIRNP